jgi:predicted transcriptional regulator
MSKRNLNELPTYALVTKKEVAKILGVSASSIARVLPNLKRSGIINRHGSYDFSRVLYKLSDVIEQINQLK